MSLHNSEIILNLKIKIKKGSDGNGIEEVRKISSISGVDTYEIVMAVGSPKYFTVSEGPGISSITKTATEANLDTYTIALTNGDNFYFNVKNGFNGLNPLFLITSDAGSIVTLTKGSTTITAEAISEGNYKAEVPSYGVWTVTSTLNSSIKTENIDVNEVKIYELAFSHFQATITVTFPSGGECYISGGGSSWDSTSSPLVANVTSAGAYTITLIYSGSTYTDNVNITYSGESVSLSLPNPADLPANVVDNWLMLGGVSGSYADLDAVIADSTAIAQLMGSQDAVDYLVRSTDFAPDITDDQTTMSIIGLNSYATDSLLADSTWLNEIVTSANVTEVLPIKIPDMVSNMSPSGRVFYRETASGQTYGPYTHAYNPARYEGTQYKQIPTWTGYQFASNTAVYAASFKMFGSAQQLQSGTGTRNTWTMKIQASDAYNGTFVDVSDSFSYTFDNRLSMVDAIIPINGSSSYKAYRIYIESSSPNDYVYSPAFNSIQMYGKA